MSKRTFDELVADLLEAGRTMSGANLSKLHSAIPQIMDVHQGTCDMGADCPMASMQNARTDWDGTPLNEAGQPLTQKERDALPKEDFAGKGTSYPIKIPQDVADAAASIGRAGADNYDSATLKANIIRIAKAKGAAFVAKLPDAWKAAQESDFEVGYVALEEKALRQDGSFPIKLIEPGWGSSGYYSPQVLERDGAKAFPAGTKMYLDHPTAAEDADRPERSVRDLAATLTTAARWQPNGPAGPGLYAEAKALDAYRPLIEELVPHIGLSIRAGGALGWGEAEGKSGAMVEAIYTGKSVDFVTEPGAGGKVLELFESARNRVRASREDHMATIDDKELATLRESAAKGDEAAKKADESAKKLQEAETELARHREASLVREASVLVAAQLRETTLPEPTQERMVGLLSAKPPIKEGALDKDALKVIVEKAAKDEAEYLAKLGGGRITGMGSSGSNVDEAALDKSIEAGFRELGLSEAGAKVAAAGR